MGLFQIYSESNAGVGAQMSEAVFSGELHYWRHESDEWDELLDELVKMGFTAVSSCVPWSVHERHAGPV